MLVFETLLACGPGSVYPLTFDSGVECLYILVSLEHEIDD